jgi:predicted  nucleic acid-binding Zn-ribbon protein
MPTTLEERVAYLEGKVEEHSCAWQDLKEAIRETNQRITHMEQKFDQRFTNLEQRIDNRFEAIDRRFEAMDRRFEAIDQKFSKYFLWIIGIQVSVLLAVIAVMLRVGAG